MIIRSPLADQIRPRNLEEFQGQKHLVGKGKILRTLIKNDQIPSIIFWGPPGTGKTTLAKIIAEKTQAFFVTLSAVTSGKKDLMTVIKKAEIKQKNNQQTILFIDEIHRWNKAQQDALLPYVEKGTLILIGATTENPSFSIINALISRSRVLVLKKLSSKTIVQIIQQAFQAIKISPLPDKKVLDLIAYFSNGDARIALNTLEICLNQKKPLTINLVKKILQKKHLFYDRAGDEHYNIISAFHKSMRGGDINATLYWLNRMLAGGEDPLFIARRIIRFASEDIGLANSLALPQAISAYDACRFIGMPECGVNLAQAAVYMAKSKKSIALYEAYENIMQDIKQTGNLPVPLHLRNAPTKLMGDLGYGKNYKYTPKSTAKENKEQTFLPPELKNKKWIKINDNQ